MYLYPVLFDTTSLKEPAQETSCWLVFLRKKHSRSMSMDHWLWLQCRSGIRCNWIVLTAGTGCPPHSWTKRSYPVQSVEENTPWYRFGDIIKHDQYQRQRRKWTTSSTNGSIVTNALCKIPTFWSHSEIMTLKKTIIWWWQLSSRI